MNYCFVLKQVGITIRKETGIIICIVLLLLFVLVSGCVEDNESEEITGDTSSKTIEEIIVGMWINQGNLNGTSYAIVYDFFSNSSFFTGLYNFNSSSYLNSQWGIYGMNNKTIFFNETGEAKSNTSMAYYFSKDFDTLALRYDGSENYILFTRSEQQ